MKKFFIFVFIFFDIVVWGQNVGFTKKEFPNNKEELGDAVKNIHHGDALFSDALYYYEQEDFSHFRNAIPYYTKAYELNSNNAQLNYKLGVCILHTIHNEAALPYLQKAYDLDSKVEDDLDYYLAKAHQYNENWESAIYYYKEYLSALTNSKHIQEIELNAATKDVNKKVQECQYGISFSAEPISVKIENVGTPINTEFPEYGVVISADESVMYFTSRRPQEGEQIKEGHEHNFMEDVFVSYKQNNGSWSKPKGVGNTINGDNHDATVALSPDGHTLLVYKADLHQGGIYHCELHGDQWGHPLTLKHIDTDAHESSACYSPDQRILFFVSDKKEDNYGGKDIFYSIWNRRKAEWSEPKNIGGHINTAYDEEAVFMQADGKTLYFSSKGHTSMGGHDVFKTVFKDDSTWSTPVNLGYPVNGPEDDVFFVMAANGKHGYYATHHKDSYGDKDIYKITFTEKKVRDTLDDALAASVTVLNSQTTLLKGVVHSSINEEPLGANIEIVDNETHEVIAVLKSNSVTGKYLITLPSGRNYGITVQAKDHLFHSENLNINSGAEYNEIYRDITLSSLEVGSAVVLNNVFFDSRKWDIREESVPELDRLVEIMEANPTMKIEISGHTDNIGSKAYNQNLSEQRAKSVAGYLQSKNVEGDRLHYAGYGFDQPIASNDTNEGRQLNRRTEFKIVSK